MKRQLKKIKGKKEKKGSQAASYLKELHCLAYMKNLL